MHALSERVWLSGEARLNPCAEYVAGFSLPVQMWREQFPATEGVHPQKHRSASFQDDMAKHTFLHAGVFHAEENVGE